MERTLSRGRVLVVGLLLAAALVLLGLHLSRATAPTTGDGTEERRAGGSAPAGEIVREPADLGEALRPPDPEDVPLATAESAPEAFPRSAEIDRLAKLAGRHIGGRLGLHFDVELYAHGGPVPALERIEVSPETLDTLIGLLDSQNPDVRRDAAIRLSAAVLRPEDLPLLRAALEQEMLDAKERPSRHAALAIAFALAAQGDRTGTERLERAVLGGERREDTVFRREAVLVLGMIADDDSSPALREVLRADPDRNVRAHAAQGLGRIGGDENRVSLADSLVRDGTVEVRAWSALAYGRAAATDGSQALPLRDAAGGDPEPLVRGASTFALARAGGPGTSGILVDTYYRDPETYPRLGALAGLTQRKKLGASKEEFLRTEGVTWLAETARSSQDHVALYFTVRTLRRIPGPTSREGILSVVDGAHPDWVRNEAVRQAARQDPARALPDLQARLATEERPSVRKTLEREIRRIERRAAKKK